MFTYLAITFSCIFWHTRTAGFYMIHANEDYQLWALHSWSFYIQSTYHIFCTFLTTFAFSFRHKKKKKKITTKVLGQCKYTISSAHHQKSYCRERVTFCGYSDLSAGKFLQSCQNIYPKMDTSFLKKMLIQREWMISYEDACAHTKHRRKILYFYSLMVNYYIPFTAFFSCPRHYYNVGLEGGGIPLKIRICKLRRKEPHYLCKFFVGLPWQAFQQKWWHKQHPLSFPFTVWFLSHIVSSVFVNKALFVWLFNNLDWKATQVTTQQRTGVLFFSFKVIGSWVSSVTWCITLSHKQLSSAQMRDGTERKRE